MKRYLITLDVNSGFDVSISAEETQNAGKAEALLDEAIANADFGEIEYSHRSSADIIKRDDGTYDAHCRIYGRFEIPTVGRDKNECFEKAVEAYEIADFGQFADESIEFDRENVSYEEITLSCLRTAQIVSNTLKNARKGGEGALLPFDTVASLNMDLSGYSAKVYLEDTVLDTVSLDVYSVNGYVPDDILPYFKDGVSLPSNVSKRKLVDDVCKNLIGQLKDITTIELKDVLANISLGELEKVNLIQNGKEISMDKAAFKSVIKECIEKE